MFCRDVNIKRVQITYHAVKVSEWYHSGHLLGNSSPICLSDGLSVSCLFDVFVDPFLNKCFDRIYWICTSP